ncbi:hypothetical protein Syun_015182 [Stephania yunnanensis]|uniref:Reticulon-like protein n=1 Tax=Stephania yunnanensis TaxID=152371 RepID=A0AAP0JKU6_9MAGN
MREPDLDTSSSSDHEDSFEESHQSLCRKPVHQILGGGAVADVLLWRRPKVGGFVLVCASATWFLFERAGYSILSVFANAMMLLVVILFFWAKSAALLNRPLPPLPDLEVSEHFVGEVADVACVWINRVLAIAQEITFSGNVVLFLKVALGLWFVSYVGSLFNFLTLVYIGVVFSLTVPVFYEKYRSHVDEKLCLMQKVVSAQYRKIDENILRKMPKRIYKEKKTQ